MLLNRPIPDQVEVLLEAIHIDALLSNMLKFLVYQ